MMKRLRWAALSAACVAALAPRVDAVQLTAEGAEDRLIVGFRPGVDAADQRKAAESLGLTVLDEIPILRLLLVQARSGVSDQAIGALRTDPAVSDVQHDIWTKWIDESPAAFQTTPLPPIEAVMNGLPLLKGRGEYGRPPEPGPNEVQWGVQRVNAPKAWPTNQGDGVKVAVIDTGIDPTHPDLKNQVAGGYNAVAKGEPWNDDHFHGTHVAGIIAAELNGSGVVGVAPKARLYAVKVLTKDGSGSLFTIMDGITWAAQNGMQVINMSLGSPQSIPFLQMALQTAKNAGITIVAAAGNGDGNGGPSPVNYPAAYPECIAVSALAPDDTITPWSSRGPEVAFIAPGLKVPSTVPINHDPSGVKAYSGTSMASPHVAGLAALAVAKGAQGPDAVRSMLENAAVKVAGLSASEQGRGVIDAAKLAK